MINNDMWALYVRDLNGCANALVAQSEELDDERDPLAIRATARRVESIARRLRAIANDVDEQAED